MTTLPSSSSATPGGGNRPSLPESWSSTTDRFRARNSIPAAAVQDTPPPPPPPPPPPQVQWRGLAVADLTYDDIQELDAWIVKKLSTVSEALARTQQHRRSSSTIMAPSPFDTTVNLTDAAEQLDEFVAAAARTVVSGVSTTPMMAAAAAADGPSKGDGGDARSPVDHRKALERQADFLKTVTTHPLAVLHDGPLGAGVTLLWQAAAVGNSAVVSALLELGADGEFERPEGGIPPLYIAAQNGHFGVCSVLLREGSVQVDHHRRDTQATPLFIAVQGGHMPCVRLLLLHGAATEALNHQGCTPFVLACSLGFTEIALELLSAGARVDDRRTGKTGRQWGKSNGHQETCRAVAEYMSERLQLRIAFQIWRRYVVVVLPAMKAEAAQARLLAHLPPPAAEVVDMVVETEDPVDVVDGPVAATDRGELTPPPPAGEEEAGGGKETVPLEAVPIEEATTPPPPPTVRRYLDGTTNFLPPFYTPAVYVAEIAPAAVSTAPSVAEATAAKKDLTALQRSRGAGLTSSPRRPQTDMNQIRGADDDPGNNETANGPSPLDRVPARVTLARPSQPVGNRLRHQQQGDTHGIDSRAPVPMPRPLTPQSGGRNNTSQQQRLGGPSHLQRVMDRAEARILKSFYQDQNAVTSLSPLAKGASSFAKPLPLAAATPQAAILAASGAGECDATPKRGETTRWQQQQQQTLSEWQDHWRMNQREWEQWQCRRELRALSTAASPSPATRGSV